MTNPVPKNLVRWGVVHTLIWIAGALCNPAMAQVAAPFIGSWKAVWQTDRNTYEAAMKVSDKGGTWQTYIQTRGRSNPCAGREVPIKVESASPTEVQLMLQFSEVIQGCADVSVVLKAAPDGTVTGTRSKYDLTLTKQ